MIVRTETIDERIRAHMDRMQPDKIVVVVSHTSEKLCLPKLEIHKKLDNIIYIVPDGDKAKSLTYCEDFWETMLRENVTRKSLVLAVGGGAVLDFTGFCASTFMRGIPFIYVPTTLLSMVDGSQGGKTGINLYGTKNIVGTFTEPLAVMRNIDFLPTLDTKQIQSGWAEIIKHAILEGKDLYHIVQNGIPDLSDTETWMHIIRKNIILKSSIVEEDFRETHQRKLLNLGHTIGHGIEALRFEDDDVTHGLCIANGLYWETLLAEELGVCNSKTTQNVSSLVYPLFFKIQWSKSEVQPMLQLLLHDKKNHEGKIQFSFTKEIGNCTYDYEVSPERLLVFLEKHAIADQVNED